jgi:predicted DNA-binding transcriptional regulator
MPSPRDRWSLVHTGDSTLSAQDFSDPNEDAVKIAALLSQAIAQDRRPGGITAREYADAMGLGMRQASTKLLEGFKKGLLTRELTGNTQKNYVYYPVSEIR